MREHRYYKRMDADDRNSRTPDSRRASFRRLATGRSLTEEWDRIKDVVWGVEHARMKREMRTAADVSKRGMRPRRTRTDHEAAKMVRDLATAAGQTYEKFALDERFHTGVPEQMTARQRDVYDLLGDI